MFTSGHTSEMVARDKNNRALRDTSRSKRAKLRELYLTETRKRELEFPSITAKEFAAIKSKIRASIIAKRKRAVTIGVTVTVLAALCIATLLYFFVF